MGRTSPIINHNEYKWASHRHVLRRLGGPVCSRRPSDAAGASVDSWGPFPKSTNWWIIARQRGLVGLHNHFG